MPFLLDANAFIESKNRHYAFDFCPAYWDWVLQQNEAGEVFSVWAIREELLRGDDELTQWAKQRDASFFLEPDEAVVGSMQVVAQWAAAHQVYTQAAKDEFLDSADYQLVAHAHGLGMTVVTHERRQASARRIKIPNACHELDVPCVSLYDAIRQTGASFVLGG